MDVGVLVRQLGGLRAGSGVEHFGAPGAEAEWALAGVGAVIVPLMATTPLRVTGADRAAFLHGQLSNVVQGLEGGASNHTLQLNARGQIVGEAVLAVRGDALFLAVEDGRGPEVRASLARHIVFDDVAVADLSGGLAALTVQGAEAAAVVERVLGTVPAPGRFALPGFGDASVLVVPRRRSSAGGLDLHLLARQLPEMVAALSEAGGRLAGERALTLARIVAGVPSAARDGGPGALPQEVGLESAVSYRKGCYLGQEIMARIEARGAVRRALARVHLEGAPEVLTALGRGGERTLRLGDREVGWLGSLARRPEGDWVALAVLRSDVSAEASLAVAGVAVRLWPGEAGWVAPPAVGDGTGERREGAVQPAGRDGTDL